MSERRTRRLLIHGRVQGVWFRESMRLEAERLGVTGWVRNRADGSVEAMVQGEGPALVAIERWARRGPEAAEVSGVEAFDAAGDFAKFEKRPSG
jgi:acylphosphatase